VTCNSNANIDCSSKKHLCIEMFTGFMKNLELLLSLKGELTEKKEQSLIQLSASIEKKKMIQRYLDVISGALISYFDEQQRKKDENQASLTELTSLLNEVPDDDWVSQQLLSLPAVKKCKSPTSTSVTTYLSKLGNASTSTASTQQFTVSAVGNSTEKRSTTAAQVIQANIASRTAFCQETKNS